MPEAPHGLTPLPDIAVLPAWAARCSVAIPGDAMIPDDVLPPRLATAVRSRRAEFAAGRFCAATALEALGVSGSAALGQRSSGAPDWPAAVVGSITHTRTFASAAVARREHAASIAIDTETVIEPDRAARVAPGILDEDERTLAAASAEGPALWTTAAFSAKESLYKLLHPLAGRYFHYSAATVTVLDVAHGAFRIRLVAGLSGRFEAGLELPGRIAVADGRVHTGMWLAPA